MTSAAADPLNCSVSVPGPPSMRSLPSPGSNHHVVARSPGVGFKARAARPTGERVIAVATVQRIEARATVEDVVAQPAIERIVAPSAAQRVVARASVEGFPSAPAGNRIVPVAADERGEFGVGKDPVAFVDRMVSAPPARLTMMSSNVEQSNAATSVPKLRTSSMLVLPSCSRMAAPSSSPSPPTMTSLPTSIAVMAASVARGDAREPQPHEKQPHDTSGRSMEPSQAERPASARGCRTAEREASGHGFVPRCICHPALSCCQRSADQ